MGSFTELSLSFTFARATPLEFLGAFGQWRTGRARQRLLPGDAGHGTPLELLWSVGGEPFRVEEPFD
jgi:hypothetical protein